jgi:two-component system, OmpR family, sensor kinase
VMIYMDRNKLGRLIDNIISNAIKYNRIGGNIDIVLKEKTLKVSDTGIGIPADKIERIFERYQRANDSVGGFGIGLNIVAMIAKEYDIEIKVDSVINKGTVIELNF